MPDKQKFILVILDGWGIAKTAYGNAIAEARMPTINMIERGYPAFILQASGIGVGLPWGEKGNSEVGHLNIGAGKAIFQYLPRIISAIQDGSFFKNPAFLKATAHVKKRNSSLHLMGLLSSGSVHSYIDHLYALMELAREQGISNVFIHLFTDGKDSPPTSGARMLENLQERLRATKLGRLATIMGRTYAMDRNNNWELTKRAYNLLVHGEGARIKNPAVYLRESYDKDIMDTDIEPAVIMEEDDRPVGLVGDNDAVIFFNFREDSARQLTKMFVLPEIEETEMGRGPQNIVFVGMTAYQEDFSIEVAFPPPTIPRPLARVLSEAGYTQLHIAETEKYAHITYFLNGQTEKPHRGEERILVPSAGSPHYDQNPEMGALQITARIEENYEKFDCVIANYANADILGHTGNLQAAISGIETVDGAIARLFELTQKNNAYLFISADHGNAEEMRNPRTHTIMTEHTSNPVPFYIVHPSLQKQGMHLGTPLAGREPNGFLADIAPTILSLLKIEPPKDMNGKNLLPRHGLTRM